MTTSWTSPPSSSADPQPLEEPGGAPGRPGLVDGVTGMRGKGSDPERREPEREVGLDGDDDELDIPSFLKR